MTPVLALTFPGACLAFAAASLILVAHISPFLWLRRHRHWSYLVLVPILLGALAFVPLADAGPKGGGWMLVWWAYPLAGLYFFSNESPDHVSIVSHIVIVLHHTLAVGLALLPGVVSSRRSAKQRK